MDCDPTRMLPGSLQPGVEQIVRTGREMGDNGGKTRVGSMEVGKCVGPGCVESRAGRLAGGSGVSGDIKDESKLIRRF